MNLFNHYLGILEYNYSWMFEYNYCCIILLCWRRCFPCFPHYSLNSIWKMPPPFFFFTNRTLHNAMKTSIILNLIRQQVNMEKMFKFLLITNDSRLKSFIVTPVVPVHLREILRRGSSVAEHSKNRLKQKQSKKTQKTEYKRHK